MTGQGAFTPAAGAAAGVQAGDAAEALRQPAALIASATCGKALEQGTLPSKQARGASDLLHDNDVDDVHQH